MEAPPATVWLLWHIPPSAAYEGDESMLIGVYSSYELAAATAARLAPQPGFVDHPALVESTDQPGFMIVDYQLDRDHWTEGYRTERA